MIIHLTAGQPACLLDPDNFRAFKVLAEPALRDGGALPAAIAGIGRLADESHVWVAIERLEDLGRRFGGAGWAEGLAGMLAFARRSGWIEPGTGAVRAHIEFGAPPAAP